MNMAWKVPIRRATIPPVKSLDPQAAAAHRANTAVRNVVSIRVSSLLICRLVNESYNPRTECLGMQELQSIHAHMLENARPFSESNRKHKTVKLIHQVMLEQRV